MKNMKRAASLLILPLFFLLSAAGVGRGQVSLDITRQAPPRLPVGLILPESLAEFNRVLEQDLRWSGFFETRRLPAGSDWPAGLSVLRVAAAESGLRVMLVAGTPPVARLDRTYRLAASDERALAHRVAREVIEELTGQSAVTESRIAAVRQEGKARELVIMDYDGANRKFLTSNGTLNLSPRFSPDGRSLIYTSFADYWPAIRRLTLAGGRVEKLAAYPGLNSAAAFSPDGRRLVLALSKDGNPDLYLLDLAGGGLKRLTNHPANDTSPVFFPDGKRLAFVSDRAGGPQIYRLELDSGRTERLTFEGGYNTSPDISPDGRFLAYTSRQGGQFEIRILVLESGRHHTVTSGAGSKEDPAFASNSRHLVFVHTAKYRSELRLLDIFTGEDYKITEDGGYRTPDWR
ncbi:MAG TPA: hypothetical protein PKN80_06515 [bacterium]|nr:hypothetical protein [bacterium]HNS48185.1 hypothetical protein [bacterium]